jgi:hypothetical protein
MSATVDRPAAPAAAAPAGPPPRALARAEGLELLGEVSGSGYKAGTRLARRADGQVVQLGPLMYALLEEIDGERDAAVLAAAMTQRLGRRLGPEHVVRIAEKLAAQGLIAGFEDRAPPKSNPLLSLRWKVLVTDPKVTRALTRPFVLLFRPWVLVPALLVLAFAVGFVASWPVRVVLMALLAASAWLFARRRRFVVHLEPNDGAPAQLELGGDRHAPLESAGARRAFVEIADELKRRGVNVVRR